MPLLIDPNRSGSDAELRGANCITIGFVNNMPDAAWEATERQFVDSSRRGDRPRCPPEIVFVGRGAARGARAENLAGRYRDAADLWNVRLDGLIVTGTEPRAKDLKDEPYWPALAAIVDCAREHTVSTIWSCLAAHAAVLHADGIVRRPLKEKLSGVFDCDRSWHCRSCRLARSAAARAALAPQRSSRAGADCERLSHSEPLGVAGVDVFARIERHSLFLFLQGHPNMTRLAAARVSPRRRPLSARRARHFPALPRGYFDHRAAAAAEDFRVRALRGAACGRSANFRWARSRPALQTLRHSATGIYETGSRYLKRPQGGTADGDAGDDAGAPLAPQCSAERTTTAGAGAPGRRAAGE